MEYRYVFGFAILVCLLGLGLSFHLVENIEYRHSEDLVSNNEKSLSQEPAIQIGVISRYAPSRIFDLYQPLMDDLSVSLGRTIQLKLADSYHDTLDQLTSGVIDAAFLGSYIYGRTHQERGLQVIAAPVDKDGSSQTRVALIVDSKGPYQNLADLKGKALALPSEQSFSAKWFRLMELKKEGMTTDDFQRIETFDYHHTVVFQVLWGPFDAGVVRESVAEEFRHQGLKVLAYSDPFPSPPLACLKTAPQQLVAQLRQAILDWNPESSPNQARNFYGFKTMSDKDYSEMIRGFSVAGDKP